MDRVALLFAGLFSLLLAFNGSLATPAVFARKGHSPKRGAVVGAVVSSIGGLVTAVVLLLLFPGQGIIAALGSLAGGIVALRLLWRVLPDTELQSSVLPEGAALKRNIEARHLRSTISKTLYLVSILVALAALVTLIGTILNKTIGLTAVQYAVEPEDLLIAEGQPSGRPLSELNEEELGGALGFNLGKNRVRKLILENVVQAREDEFKTLSEAPVNRVLEGHSYPAELADTPFNKLTEQQAGELLVLNMERAAIEHLLFAEVIRPEVQQSWPLWESITQRGEIERLTAEKYPQARLEWKSWLSWKFISSPLDPRQPDATGLRPALIGSLMVILITILVAFPVGVGAAIYLEEYAADNRLNRLIQTNIANLAGVPSIIYGMLGLAIFVRALSSLTSGNLIGTSTANGRTVLSAGFTLALLVLPVIIINAQEAIRAVPASLRQASYGLGATQWQTIWHHVLPSALPGILTGTILAISRAIGETAPLILVGAATYITQDPKGPFSNFTALPMVIYRWTTYPQAEFGNAAAAAIVVLLALLLTLNSFAIVLRNRFSRRGV